MSDIYIHIRSKSKGSIVLSLNRPTLPNFEINCSFLQNMFHHIEKLLYVDLDVLFLNGLTDIWHYSYEMNQSQMVAMGHNTPDPTQYVKIFHPKYPLSKAECTYFDFLFHFI